MSPDSKKPFIGLSLHPDQVCMVEVAAGQIQAIGDRELVQPFHLKTFQSTGRFLENQAEVLAELYQKSGCKGKDVGVVLNAEMALIKKVPVALGMDEDFIKGQIVWEAEQFLVDSLDTYVHDFARLPSQAQSGNLLYVITLVRKSVVSGIQAMLSEIGLSMRDLDIDVFSNIRCLLANYDIADDDVSVLIDIQRQNLLFYFIREREFFLSHRVSIHEGGSASEFHNVTDIVELLMKELRRLIFGYRLGNGIDDLNHLFLVGNEVVQEIAQEFSTSITTPIEVVNPFRRIAISETVSKSQNFISFPERFITAVGMALKNARTERT